MSTEVFEDYFFDACNLPYDMEIAMQPLTDLMKKTSQVRIWGPNDTDLSFSIAGMAAM